MLEKLYSSRSNFHAILLTGLSLFFLGVISRFNVLDLDLFHEMAFFREVLRLGQMPDHDLYSYIPTLTPVVHHEWGTGALLYLLVVGSGLGAGGLMACKYLLTLFVMVNCYRLSRRRGAGIEIFSYFSFFAIILGAIGFTTIRAQLFTLCFLLMMLSLLDRDRRGHDRALWLLPLLFAIWLNMHAGFVTGLILLGVYLAELLLTELLGKASLRETLCRLRGKFAVFAMCCALPLLSPHGVAYYPYLWRAITLDRTGLIKEWRPIWELSLVWLAVFLVIQAVLIYALRQKGYKKMPGLLMLEASAWAGLTHARHLSIFSVIFLCYAPAYLEGTALGDFIVDLWRKRNKFIAFLFIAAGVFGLFQAVSNEFWRLKVPAAREQTLNGLTYPVGAVDFLKKHGFSGNLLTPFQAGSYVSWHLYPQVRVSMDSRFEVAYPYASVEENYNFYRARPGWRETLEKYDTHALLIPNWMPIKKEIEKISVGTIAGTSEAITAGASEAITAGASEAMTAGASEAMTAGTSNKPLGQAGAAAPRKAWKRVYSDGAYCVYLSAALAKNYPVVDLGEATVPGVFP